MSTCNSFPSHLITKVEALEVLKKDKGDDVYMVSWEEDNYSQSGENQVTEIRAFHVTYTVKRQKRRVYYVIKYTPDPVRNMIGSFSDVALHKEAMVYRDLLSEMSSELVLCGNESLKIPKYMDSFSGDERDIIILEDLRSRGFRKCDRKKTLDIPHINLVLKELGRIHAAGILLKTKYPDNELQDKFECLKIDLNTYSSDGSQKIQKMFSNEMKSCANALQEIGGYEMARDWLLDNEDKGVEIMTKHLRTSNLVTTICHGDCWMNNFLYRYDTKGIPKEVTFVDFELCREASPVTDLQIFFMSSVDNSLRKTHSDNFFSVYFNSFSEVLQSASVSCPYTLQDLRQEYMDKYIYGLLFGLILMKFNLTESETGISDDDRIGNINFTQEILSGNEHLKSHFLSMFDEMIEYGAFR